MAESNNAGWVVRALRQERHGLPQDVLTLSDVTVNAPQAGEAVVAMRAAAIHYSDLGQINGTYGRLRALPGVAGREGVGEVVALGPGTKEPKIGTLVRMPEEQGVWREAVTTDAAGLFPILEGVAVEQAAMAFINPPTAWRLLHDFVQLRRGEWLIQNAGTSAVGVLVAQMSRYFGYRCISVVRDISAKTRLIEAGAAVVVAEDSGYEKDIKTLTGGAAPMLALNAVGGESVVRLCRAIGSGETIVTYGGAATELVRFPTRQLIFNDINLRGFWLDAWVRTRPAAGVQTLWKKMIELLAEGKLSQPISGKYELSDWQTALDKAFQGGREGKLLFTGEWKP